MKDLIKKYEELLVEINGRKNDNEYYYFNSIQNVVEDLKALEKEQLNKENKQFSNPQRILLQRLVKDEIATPRKKYGTSKMNTLYSLEGKLRK
jgi:hypothetical protein